MQSVSPVDLALLTAGGGATASAVAAAAGWSLRRLIEAKDRLAEQRLAELAQRIDQIREGGAEVARRLDGHCAVADERWSSLVTRVSRLEGRLDLDSALRGRDGDPGG